MTTQKIRMPFNDDYRMTQKFGVFYYYKNRKVKHLGVDWALPGDTQVVACFAGIVSRVEKYRLTGYGRSIYLRSLDGSYEALYAHLQEINVEVGDRVKMGNIIGRSGRSGFCIGKTGYHLHFGLKKYNEYIDPLPLLKEDEQLSLENIDVDVPIPPDGEYTVKKGDSLWDIAIVFYGDGNRWSDIFNANLDCVDNPDVIFPGQVLKIPNL